MHLACVSVGTRNLYTVLLALLRAASDPAVQAPAGVEAAVVHEPPSLALVAPAHFEVAARLFLAAGLRSMVCPSTRSAVEHAFFDLPVTSQHDEQGNTKCTMETIRVHTYAHKTHKTIYRFLWTGYGKSIVSDGAVVF